MQKYSIENLTKKELTTILACLGREYTNIGGLLFSKIAQKHPDIWESNEYLRIRKALEFSPKPSV